MVLVSNRQTRISVECMSVVTDPNLLLLNFFTRTTTGGHAPMPPRIGYAADSIAAATTDVVLVVEETKILHRRTALQTQDCSATVFFRVFRNPF